MLHGTSTSNPKPKRKTKPSLKLDVAEVNSTAEKKEQSQQCRPRRVKPDGRTHTSYVDLVEKLRNPAGAGTLLRWMEGRRGAG